ncbi:CerR family C-terminal domain-containing protein [Rhizobiaceae bacterium n13]|uniref:CerR family C-terminal domain-containing protein n=1 Tax=Ferirhizobium litorale TaxID=2927786 RepID=A0AAE3TZH5_9HYPH|nr:CerR family C-terminal domain-containing protein [Fererhizobium litorale]MDI7860846.1 CerR family C-terminal domain-containing protein [Fererhizobium litorale]MDI7920994.1 CerR family C-terminal domain-containing protein [Fererhizobium litorale]
MEKLVSGAMATRHALVSAALRLFGEHGYDSVSTRQIADVADANIGSIAYHFGGKPGLRTACAQYVVGAITEALAPDFPETLPADLPPEEASRMFIGMLTTFVTHAAEQADADEIFTFIMREMVRPGEVVQHLCRETIGPVHDRLCELFAIATGRSIASDNVSVIVFSMMGQAMYFRMSKPVITQKMQWDDIGPQEAEAIVEVLKVNLQALLDYYRKSAGEISETRRIVAGL